MAKKELKDISLGELVDRMIGVKIVLIQLESMRPPYEKEGSGDIRNIAHEINLPAHYWSNLKNTREVYSTFKEELDRREERQYRP